MTKRFIEPGCLILLFKEMLLRYSDKTGFWCSLKIVLCRLTICDILKAHLQSRCYSTLIGWCQRLHPINVEQILLLHRLRMQVAWKDAFLENYLAILAEQKHYFSVWLRASNERYCSFLNWRQVIIKHEKLFAAKFCPETNVRFINCSQLLPPWPLITHWNWKLTCSSVHFLCSFFHLCWGAIRTKKWWFLLNKWTEPNERRNVLNSISGSV